MKTSRIYVSFLVFFVLTSCKGYNDCPSFEDSHVKFDTTISVNSKENASNTDSPFIQDSTAIQTNNGEDGVSTVPMVIAADNVLLLIDSDAMSHDVQISIETTTEEQSGPMPDYLANLNVGGAVYRMLPDGLKFNRDITIAIRYDSTALPYGYTADDIYTFFYNEQTHIWQRVERDSVDIQNQIVYSRTNHFTDYINGVLKVPENSDAMAYTPTSIKDLKAADPMEGITLIAPPEANNMGTVNLTYPLTIPAGRRGMQPQLAVTYNSSGGSGILGLGWGLPVSEICVDTRRGVPLFSDTLETETYVLDGELLVTSCIDSGLFRLNKPAYFSPWKSRVSGMDSLRFYPRVEGSFRRVVRYGTGPTNYYWVVTDKLGTKYYYGMEDSTCLKDSRGNIARWCLQRVEDTYGNVMIYSYTTKDYAANGGNPAKQILLYNINYTAYKPTNESGKYNISFHYSTTEKTDAVTSARFGFLESDAYLLDHIDVLYNNNLVKSYYFGYKHGAFGRTLLCNVIDADSVAQQYGCSDCSGNISAGENSYISCFIQVKSYRDSLTNAWLQWNNGNGDMPDDTLGDFYVQLFNCLYGDSLAYYDGWYIDNSISGIITDLPVFERDVYSRCEALDSSCKRMGYSEHRFTYTKVPRIMFSQEETLTNDDENSDELAGPLFLVKGSPGPIEGTGTKTWNIGGALDVGYDAVPYLKSTSVGGGFTYSQSESYGLITLIDLNGDGLVDKIYKRGNDVYCRFRDPDNPTFFLGETTLPNLNDFLSSFATSSTWDVEGSLGGVAGASFGVNWTESNSYMSTYFCDVDGDGLPDLVKDGKVLYNRLCDDAIGMFHAVDDNAQFLVISSCGRKDTVYTGLPVDTALFSDYQDTTRLMWDCWTVTVDEEYGTTRDTCGWVPYGYSYPKPYRPNLENVRFWQAPHPGRIWLRDTVSMPQTQLSDGMRLITQFNEDSVFLKDTIALPGTDTTFLETFIDVVAGDRIYFRLLSRNGRVADRISWNPTISYVDSVYYGELQGYDSSGIDTFRFSYRDDYLLSGIQKITMPFDDSLKIEASAFVPEGSSFVGQAYFEVLTNTSSGVDTILMQFNISNDSTPNIDHLSFTKGDWLQARIVADGPINWSLIRTKYRVTVLENRSVGTDDTVYPCIDTLSRPGDTVYFFDYYPQIQKLVYANGNSNGMYAGYDSSYSYFGTMYRNWGQFAYKSPNNHSVIHFSELHPAGIESMPDSAHFSSISSNPQLSLSERYSPESEVFLEDYSAYNPLADVFFPMQPDFRRDCWSAYSDYAYIEQNMLSNTPHPADGISESRSDSIEYLCSAPIANSDAKVVNKNTYNKSFGMSGSVNFNIGGLPLGGGASRTVSQSRLLTDMMDLNGDRYPDALTEKGVQYTQPFGGLSSLARTWDDECPLIESTLYTINGGSFGGSAIVEKWQLNKSVRNAAKELSAKVGADVSGTNGNGVANVTWADLNGDGLPDRIFQKGDSLTYRQNIGHGFLPEVYYDKRVLRQSTSKGNSGGASLSAAFEDSWWNHADSLLNILDSLNNLPQTDSIVNKVEELKNKIQEQKHKTTLNVSITAGFGTSCSRNNNDAIPLDINGDGLPDYVEKQPNYYTVNYNTGNSFDGGVGYLILGDSTDNYSYTTDLTGALTVGVTLGIIPLKIAANIKGGFSRSLSRETAQWLDINGDGVPDYVWDAGDDHIGVKYSNLGVVNKLVGVELPSGGSYEVSYSLNKDGAESNMNHYVMSSLSIKDNRMLAPNQQRTFRYHNRHYDRIEREDYGYAKVVTVEHRENNFGYRYNVQQFHNQDYLFRGLCYSNSVIDSLNGDTLSAQRREYRLFDIITGELNSNSRPGCYGDGFPAILSDSTIYYDNGQREIVSRYRFGYSRFGNIDTVYDDGALNDPNDDYMAVSKYDSIGDYIVASVLEERITGDDVQYRHRSALHNAITGDVITLTFHNNTGGNSVYDFHYDCYGNIDTIKYPENYMGQRYFIAYKYDDKIHMLPTETTNAYNLTSAALYYYDWQKPKKVMSVNGAQSEYKLDSHGRISAIFAPFEFGTNRPTIRYEYHDCYPHTDAYWDTSMLWARTLNHNVDSDYISTITISDGLGRPRVVKKEADVDGHTMRIVGGWIELDALGRKVQEYYPYTENTLTSPDSTLNFQFATPQVRFYYDCLDRVVNTRYPDSTQILSDYSVDYDADNIPRLKVKTEDQNGNVTKSFYNIRKQNTATIDALGATTIFRYDNIGQLTKTISPDGDSTIHIYDNLGRRTDRFHPSAGHTKWEYDQAGNMLRQTQNNGEWIDYHYFYNRPTHIEYSSRPWNNVWYEYGNIDTNAGRVVRQQDATGVQEFEYDKMGNVVLNRHTYIQPQSPQVFTLETKWEYDSWGRVLNITYPDNETVYYQYDNGGYLNRIEGVKPDLHIPTVYLQKILYDHFGQRIYQMDGGHVESIFKYDSLTRRLSHLTNRSILTSVTLQDNDYYYDAVGNIDSIVDNGLNPRTQRYEYNTVNRLVASDGVLSYHGNWISYNTVYDYSPAGRILQKKSYGTRVNNSYGLFNSDYDYLYEYSFNNNPYAVSHIVDLLGGDKHFKWDDNGNLIHVASEEPSGERHLCWTEDNRLQAYTEISAEGSVSAWYSYSASGERSLKFTSPQLRIRQNALSTLQTSLLRYPTLYASPLVTLSKSGYTKHYFDGDSRICSKVGGGFGTVSVHDMEYRVETFAGDYNQLYNDQKEGVIRTFENCMNINIEFDSDIDLYNMLLHEFERTEEHEPAFYYHSDHLGSSAYLTDDSGQVTQILNYLPYGEDWVDIQNNLDPSLGQYTFNGKEKDYESDFHYYGARYYWSEVLTGWLSVDPMMDKYPGISPYNYCAWNPIKVVDPDGMDTTFFFNLDNGTTYRHEGTERTGLYFVQIEYGRETTVYYGQTSYDRVDMGNSRTIISFKDAHQARAIYDKLKEDGVQFEWNIMYLKDGSADLVTSSLPDKIRINPKDYTSENVESWRHYHPNFPDYLYWMPSKEDQLFAQRLGLCPSILDFCGQEYNFAPIIKNNGIIDGKQYIRYKEILKKECPTIRPYCN